LIRFCRINFFSPIFRQIPWMFKKLTHIISTGYDFSFCMNYASNRDFLINATAPLPFVLYLFSPIFYLLLESPQCPDQFNRAYLCVNRQKVCNQIFLLKKMVSYTIDIAFQYHQDKLLIRQNPQIEKKSTN